MVTQIIYNGAVIGTVEPGETKLIKCNDKKMTGDLEIRAGERTEIKYGGTIIAIVEAGDSKVIKCAGKTMKSNIEIRVEDGKSGTDGFSPTVELIDISGGTRLVITDINGEKSADIMDGKDGKDGYTPQKGVDYFDGLNGSDGRDGADGKTPIKGTDYFTEADKAEMVSAVKAALPVYNGEAVIV